MLSIRVTKYAENNDLFSLRPGDCMDESDALFSSLAVP